MALEQEQAYAAELEIDENKEDKKFFAIPWIDHDYDSVGSSQIIMRALYLVARENPDYKVECFEDEEAIQIVADQSVREKIAGSNRGRLCRYVSTA